MSDAPSSYARKRLEELVERALVERGLAVSTGILAFDSELAAIAGQLNGLINRLELAIRSEDDSGLTAL